MLTQIMKKEFRSEVCWSELDGAIERGGVAHGRAFCRIPIFVENGRRIKSV
jgi:hypothetical protein